MCFAGGGARNGMGQQTHTTAEGAFNQMPPDPERSLLDRIRSRRHALRLLVLRCVAAVCCNGRTPNSSSVMDRQRCNGARRACERERNVRVLSDRLQLIIYLYLTLQLWASLPACNHGSNALCQGNRLMAGRCGGVQELWRCEFGGHTTSPADAST